MVLTGLDVLQRDEFAPLVGKQIGLVCNQASIDRNCRHILSIFEEQPSFKLKAVFGPQHGLYGHTQDNMIEWEGTDSGKGYPIYSLYGEHREPTAQMLDGLDTLVIDLQDVGARYYTFIWTMALCLKACEDQKVSVLVLDRPNPIGGAQIEGEPQATGFESFVGLHPIPIRHGKTIGELAQHFQASYYPAVDLQVIAIEGWEREMYWGDAGLPWGMPSPNMPTADTAIVYPGGCLLEATNISEGRGTTRPFEIIGSPWLDARTFTEKMNEKQLPGVSFRELEFQPTFNKYSGQVCGGSFVHVLDRTIFRPVACFKEVIRTAKAISPKMFRWKEPPYEYEYEKMPIDILTGSSAFREQIDAES